MLRNDRHGHGVESHAYAYAHSHSNTDAWAGYAWKHFDSTTSRYR